MNLCKYCNKYHGYEDNICLACHEGEVVALFGDNHGDTCPCQACLYFKHDEDWYFHFNKHVEHHFEQRINDVVALLNSPPQQHPGQLTIHDFLEP